MPLMSNVRTRVEQLAATIQWLGAPIASVVISVVYFVMSRPLALARRFAVSAHGVLLTAIYVAAVAIYDTGNSRTVFVWPFLAAFLIPAVSVVLALIWYPRNKTLHLLIFPLVYCAMWIAFIGGMAVTGDWL